MNRGVVMSLPTALLAHSSLARLASLGEAGRALQCAPGLPLITFYRFYSPRCAWRSGPNKQFQDLRILHITNWRVSRSVIFATPELSDKEQKNTSAVKQPVWNINLRKSWVCWEMLHMVGSNVVILNFRNRFFKSSQCFLNILIFVCCWEEICFKLTWG